jgi:hypothetical protein
MPILNTRGTASAKAFGFTNGGTTLIEFITIAGGGSGATEYGTGYVGSGGGGAGGLLYSSTQLFRDYTYTITVGAGGPGVGGGNQFTQGPGNRGSNSSVVGQGVTLIAVGGGGGTHKGIIVAQNNGGSGGGASRGVSGDPDTNFGTGIAGQGNRGGTASGVSAISGGGGGAGGVGGTGPGGAASSAYSTWASATSSGVGGAYAGGGGGGTSTEISIIVYPGGGGGAGGGSAGVAATANTGSGGTIGLDIDNPDFVGLSGAGGSGIVIARYYGPQRFSGGTVYSSGNYTYHKFTSSGTLTS